MNAPVRYVDSYQTSMRAWYNLYGRVNVPKIKSHSYCSQIFDKNDFYKTYNTILSEIQKEAQILKNKTKKIFLGGFSQGCVITAFTGF